MSLGNRIKELRKNAGFTQEELGEKVGVQKNAVSKWEKERVKNIPHDTVEKLAEIFGVSSSYIWTGEEMPYFPENIEPLGEMRKIDLYGSIACGEPIWANNQIEDQVDLPSHIRADFALKCRGDSMINARIFDGDIVYIRKQENIENGEIAAVILENEATLKRIYCYPDHVILQPENPMYKPMVFWNEDMNKVRILGKAVSFTSVIL